jgi:hypothetical protein
LSDRSRNKSIKWAAELSHAREVTLLGTADLVFWKDWLIEEDLRPSEHGGQAQLLLHSVARSLVTGSPSALNDRASLAGTLSYAVIELKRVANPRLFVGLISP